ncbi:MAG TPA: TetR/AcrR family transcriptional regulator [Gemmatimonadaceae bacterium]|nr:TetR/AcrR family transcriptional regulator [Gemmatimonadaceae bacterium]
MPRTSRQNQQLRAESERRLLAAARATFARLGYDRATVRDIAREAGVAQGLLYNYFRGKDDLLRAVFREGARDVAESFAAADAEGAPEERLERVIRRSLAIVRERRDFWQLSYMVRHQPGTAELLGAELTAWTSAVRAQLEALLREIGHRDAPALSRVLFGAIDGVAQHYVLHPDDYPLDATADCLVRHFCSPPGAPGRARAAPHRRAPSPRTRGNEPKTRRKPHDPKR